MSMAAQIEEAARAAAAAVLQEALDRINSLEEEVVKLKDRLSTPSSKAASYDRPAARPATTAKAAPAQAKGTANK